MPFVFGPALTRDPVADFLAAALGAEASKDRKSAACGQAGACQPRRRVFKRIINPNFDISELENEYVLEGELPGVSDKSTIGISFDDAQTIVIKGELKRVSRTAAAPAERTEAVASDAASSKTLTNEDQPQEKISYAATVEDDVDESDFEVLDGPNGPKADKGKAKEADVEMTDKPAESQPQEKQEAKAPSARYWVTERSIGVFERRFNFQGLIDQDNVKASLENGLLTVVVPKRQAYVRQVQIQ